MNRLGLGDSGVAAGLAFVGVVVNAAAIETLQRKYDGADWRAQYVLAQTEARLGNFKAARAALERAFALRDVRQKALGGPLLETLWTNLN